MSNEYGYIGGSTINQVVQNNGIFSVEDIYDLKNKGHLGGSLELIASSSFSSSSAVEITTLKESIYDVHFFTFELTGSHQDHTLFLDMSTNGGSSYITDDFKFFKQFEETFSNGNGTNTSTDIYGIQVAASLDSNNGFATYGYLYGLGNTNEYSYYTGQSIGTRSGDAGEFRMEYGGGIRPNKDIINAIRFYPNVGTLTGNYKIFGIKKV